MYIRLKKEIKDKKFDKTFNNIKDKKGKILNICENDNILDKFIVREIGEYVYYYVKIFDLKNKNRYYPPTEEEEGILYNFIKKNKFETITDDEFRELSLKVIEN